MPTATIVKLKTSDPAFTAKAHDAVNKKKRLKVTVDGPPAFAGAKIIERQTSQNITGAEVTIVAAVVIALIAVTGLAVVAAVCLYGINQGYTVKAKHVARGPMPFDDELVFDLVPPS